MEVLCKIFDLGVIMDEELPLLLIGFPFYNIFSKGLSVFLFILTDFKDYFISCFKVLEIYLLFYRFLFLSLAK
jgi:hypothetical protein